MPCVDILKRVRDRISKKERYTWPFSRATTVVHVFIKIC